MQLIRAERNTLECLSPTPAFDVAAADYDSAFTRTHLARWLRETVWHYLGEAFRPGEHVLELGCGTGEDAIWLARRGVRVTATDASAAMLDQARRKAEAAGMADQIDLVQLDLAALTDPNAPLATRHSPLTGAFSNFGVLNCLPDRRPLAEALAHWLSPGGQVVLVVMGPLCPWEIGWHLLHGQLRTAVRRFQAGVEANVAVGVAIQVWYPSPRRLAAEFRPFFQVRRLVGIGALLPPSYLSPLVDRWPGFFKKVAALDRTLGKVWPWTWLNDHYLMVLERWKSDG